MPEYLSPGVYTEEIDTGSKPIEGVSTSTAGVVGVAERGPVNVPILITGYGEYTRWFGGRLSFTDFHNANGPHCFLPHGVEGFFTNGGKRVFVTRVLDTEGVTKSRLFLFDRGTAGSASTMILRAAGEASGTAANPPLLYVLDASQLTTVLPHNWVRIGDGSPAEYRQVAAIGTAGANTHVPLNFALSYPHAHGGGAAEAVDQFTAAQDNVNYAGVFLLTGGAPRGVASIALHSASSTDIAQLRAQSQTPNKPLLEIGAAGTGEYHLAVQVTILDPHTARATLEAPLAMAYPNGTTVTPLRAPVPSQTAHLALDAGVGDALIYVDNRNSVFNTTTDLVLVHAADPSRNEVRRIGQLGQITLAQGAYAGYGAASIVEKFDVADDDRALTALAPAATNTLTLDDVSFLRASDQLLVDVGVNRETVTIQSIAGSVVTIAPPNLTINHPAGRLVTPVFSLKKLTAAAPAGSRVLAVDNRISLSEGDVVRVGAAPQEEYATILVIPNRAPGGVSPDAGNLVLDHPLLFAHATGTEVRRQKPPIPDVTNPAPPTVLVLDVPAAGSEILVSDVEQYGAAPLEFVRVTTFAGPVFYHRINAAAAQTPVEVTLQTALERAHPPGSVLVGRDPLIQVEALDAGGWGNRLRISVEDEVPGLVSRTQLTTIVNPTHIRLASVAGVEAGTILELLDPLNGDAVVGDPLKVVSIDRATNFTLTLAGAGLSAAQQAAQVNAVAQSKRLGVRSRELRLTVHLLHQHEPAVPQHDQLVIDSEAFRNLSMDARHSRYFQTILGDIAGPLRLADRRPEGESWYVRVHDLAQDLPEPARTTALESVRFGPEALEDVLPTGVLRPARHALEDGDDSVATLTDDTYIGVDSINPEDRTGLHSLINVDEISIVSVPGRTSAAMQGALIDHCELMRYRFAVLDGPMYPNDSLNDVQQQRQQFDTKYAALYHPWLLIEDPFPVNLAKIPNFAIPPSGHVVGIYARTDIDRGVHKSPANEVVRGILGLQRILNKAEQDILNPFPVNINVIRDFRPDNRSIRVWGGRVITSDTDWKYVNVRRLLIFIEKSIDRGLQWVVFEPNAEPLWARVRRTISNFLTTVWRNGALEGTKPEEAYFVKCDRTTMTQTDIDNGRLIVVIGVAPVKPAEFVIIRIGLWTAHAES